MRPEAIWSYRGCPHGLVTCGRSGHIYLWSHKVTDIIAEGHIYYKSAHPNGAGVWLCLQCHQDDIYETLANQT